MGSFDSFKVALEIVSGVIKSKDQNPISSREKAKNITKHFYEKTCPKYGINVEYKFGDKSLEEFPNIVDGIKNYIENGMKLENGPLLWLGNHQAFGLEAVGAYDYFPIDGRIVLKDDLIKPPFFGDSIKSLDPIIHYRNNKELEIQRYKYIESQILNNKAVLIYPEGTRSKNGKLGNFKSSLYKTAFDTIKSNQDKISQILSVVTVDSFGVFPDTLENSILYMGNLNPGTITYTIDLVDITLYETARNINKEVREIIQFNLDSKK